MTDAMQQFMDQVDRSTMPLEKKLAAQVMVQRLRDGERLAVVLKDLAEPLGITAEMLMRHLVMDKPPADSLH